MNRNVLTRKTKILLTLWVISVLTASSITYVVAQSSTDFTLSQGIYPGAPSFTFWREGSTYFSKSAYGLVTSGTNASQVIQNAINSAVDIFTTVSGTDGEFLFLPATYELDTQLQITNNLSLLGANRGSTILKWIGGTPGGEDFAVVHFSAHHSNPNWNLNIEISGFTIDGSGDREYCVWIERANNSVVKNNILKGFNGHVDRGIGVIVGHGQNTLIENNEIYTDYTSFTYGNDGIRITSPLHGTTIIRSNYIHGQGISNGTGAINDEGHSIETVYDVIIENNIIEDIADTNGIALKSRDNVIAANNIIRNITKNVGGSHGIFISGRHIYNFRASGNTIEYAGGHGIFLASDSGFEDTFRGEVSDNTLRANGGDGINIDGPWRLQVHDNYIFNHTSGYGIRETGQSNFTSIKDNYLYNNNIQISWVGSETEVFGNMGYPSDLDMLQQSILNATFHIGTAFPSSPVEGQYFWRTDEDVLYVYNSTNQWQALSGAAGAQGPAGSVAGSPFSYLVFENSTSTYMLNGTTGVIDYNSSNDESVINSAIGNLTSERTAEETVMLKGNFSLTALIDVPSYTTLDMYQAEISTTSNIAIIEVNGASEANPDVYVNLLGGYIHGSNQSNNRILINDAQHVTVRDMRLEQFGTYVIYVENSHYTTVENCRFNLTDSFCVYVYESDYTKVLANTMNTERNGVIVGGDDDFAVGTLIDGNDIKGWNDTSYHAIYISSFSATKGPMRTTTVNNHVHDGGVGGGVAIAYRGSMGTISNNQIWNVPSFGIQVANTESGDLSSNVTVGFNTIEGATNGIEVTATTNNITSVSIVGNIIFDCTRGIVLTGTGANNVTYSSLVANTISDCTTYGIRLAANTQNNTVIANTLINVNTNLDEGTDNVQDHNIGW